MSNKNRPYTSWTIRQMMDWWVKNNLPDSDSPDPTGECADAAIGSPIWLEWVEAMDAAWEFVDH